MSYLARRVLIAAVLGALVMSARAAAAEPTPTYTLIDLGTLGGSFSFVSGPNVHNLNNAGTVAATGATSTPDADYQYANRSLDIGNSPFQVEHAFLWHNGIRSDLGTLAGPNSSNSDWINARGDAAGLAEYGPLDPLATYNGGPITAITATIWKHGQLTDLGRLSGGYESQAFALNDSDVAAGFSTNGSSDATCNSLAFFYACWGA